jgi:hypothetical protein
MQIFSKKLFHNKLGILKLNSVINVENEKFYPFLNEIITGNIQNLSKNSSTYAIIYPNDLNSFLEKQKNEGSLGKNMEVNNNC